MKRFCKKFVDLDIYGHPVGVHFKGSNKFKTKLGTFMTLVTYALILFNLGSLIIAFFDSSKQKENVQEKVIDSIDSGPFTLAENNIEFTLLTTPPLVPELGRLKVIQSYQRVNTRDVPLFECPDEVFEDFMEYWALRLGQAFSESVSGIGSSV